MYLLHTSLGGCPPQLTALGATWQASVIILCLWFWGQPPTPARYLRALRMKLPMARLVVMSDDVHHLRAQLEIDDVSARAGGRGGDASGRHGGRGGGKAKEKEKEAARLREEELRHYFHADHVISPHPPRMGLPLPSCDFHDLP